MTTAENEERAQRQRQRDAVINEHYEQFDDPRVMEEQLMAIYRAALASQEMDGWTQSERVQRYDYLRGLINFNAQLWEKVDVIE